MSVYRIWKDGEWIYFGSQAARDGFGAGECMAWATEQSCPYPRTSKEWKEWVFAFRRARGIR